MRGLGDWWVGLALWRPAARAMRGLRLPIKMLLIGAAFALPLVYLLAGQVARSMEEIRTARTERDGVRMARATYAALQHAGQWRFEARSAAFGDTPAQTADARKQYEAAHAELLALQADLGLRLNTVEGWRHVALALTAAQAADAPGAKPEALFEGLNGLSRALVALLDRSVDGSGLSLDPASTTYHLMSATLLHAPQIIQNTAELRGLGGSALQSGKLSAATALQLEHRLAVVEHELQRAQLALAKAKADAPEVAARLKSGDGPQATLDALALVRRTFALQPAAGAAMGEAPALAAGGRQAYVQAMNGALKAQFAQVGHNLVVLDDLLAQRQLGLQQSLWLSVGLSAAGALLALVLLMGAHRAMDSGFKALRKHLLSISMGDLRADISTTGRDEVGALLRELRYMQASLRETVSAVRTASDTVVRSSIEAAQGTLDLSARTEATAAALEQSSAALEQTSATVGNTTEAVAQASRIAEDNAQVAERGGAVMLDVARTMERIHDSSRRITDIIGTIDGIAFQTNILALNAAVEAARAGEQGRGFAVVASEVRSLAQRSAMAAREIKTLIGASASAVEGGLVTVRQAGSTMDEVVGNAVNIRQLLDEVTRGSREQTLGLGQIREAVQELDRATQANASLVQQAAGAAGEQRDIAVRMAARVDEFRLPDDGAAKASQVGGIDVDAIIDAHRLWKVKLRAAIEQRETVDTATLSRDDCCALGKWVHGEGGQCHAGKPNFVALIARHAEFHQAAAQVGQLINQHQYPQAEAALAAGTPFAQCTSEVVLCLSTAKRLGF